MISKRQRLQYRMEYLRLLGPENFSDINESYKLVVDVGFSLLFSHGQENREFSVWDHDGNNLYQMTLLKCLSLRQLAQSLNYVNSIDGARLKNTYDPFGMYTLVRAQYEAFCNFNNIYIQSKSEDELKLKYYLWVLSGLKYRQRFRAESDWAKKKKASEADEIAELTKLILENVCYLQLDEQSQDNVRNCMKKRDWQIKIVGNQAYKIAWHEMMTNADTNEMLEGQYTNLSLSTHPSNVSVFQFNTMYTENQQEPNAKMALQLSKTIIAMFIRDYIVHFNLQKKYFDSLPIISQMLINSYNTMFRKDNYRINQINDLLG